MADDEVMADAEKDKKVDKTGPGGTVPWVERYRPSTIDELQQQDQVARALLAAPLAPAGCRRRGCARPRAPPPRPAPAPPCGMTTLPRVQVVSTLKSAMKSGNVSTHAPTPAPDTPALPRCAVSHWLAAYRACTCAPWPADDGCSLAARRHYGATFSPRGLRGSCDGSADARRCAVAAPPVLRAARHGEDVGDFGAGQRPLWTADVPVARARAERLGRARH